MRLLFISQLFDPEYSIKGLGFLRDLKEQGSEVDVITTFPNYPTGKLFPGYKLRPWTIETMDQIRVIRVYSFISHSKSKSARALSYLTFMVSAFFAAMLVRKPDVIYAYHPQFTIGLVARLLKAIRRVPYVTDVQDLWPEALVATGVHSGSGLLRLISALCGVIYRNASQVLVLSRGYRDALTQRGVEARKVSVVYNWNAEESALDLPATRCALSSAYRYQFVYAGNLGRAQGLKVAIDAFSSLEGHSVALLIIGAGVEAELLAAHAQALGAKNIFFLGYMPASSALAHMKGADVLFFHLKDEPLFKITLPSKLQAYLSLGRPILAAVGGEANQIVEEARAGETADPEDAPGIAAAALRLIQKREQWSLMGENGQRFYEDNMSRAIGVAAVHSIVAKVAIAGLKGSR